eukprot:scaffold72292_cov23-Cyclotella_meneghiniana.AAC.2
MSYRMEEEPRRDRVPVMCGRIASAFACESLNSSLLSRTHTHVYPCVGENSHRKNAAKSC